MTLTQATFGADTFLKKAGLVLAGSIFIGIAAQISIPLPFVPLTLQTLAILIVGLTFGSRLGAITLLAYLAEGFAGLPVFAGGAAGPLVFLGPTAGFLVGFVLTAFIAGLAAERSKSFVVMALGALAASALLYIPGVAWPMGIASLAGATGDWTASSASTIWTYWVSPFLIGDAIKAVLAALIVSGGWAALSKR